MTTALSVRNLRKTYKGGHEALKGISLDVTEGDFFALLGPNGAGKTTLIGIVASLVNKSGGSVSIFGHDLDHEPASAKACIGLVPQEFNFNMFEPVVEVVANQAGYYGIERREAFARAEIYLKHLDLWDKRRIMARNLSGGMKRRLMIARALVHHPKLLILDEPTAGVDIEIRRSMWQFLRQINESGTTIILTTHYLEEAESLCRNIAIIDEGELIENTTTRQLLNTLHMETFVLDLEAPLSELPDLDGQKLNMIDEQTLEAEIFRGDSLNELFAGLSSRGIRVTSMRNKTNRLEELFMSLVENGGTGRRVS
ncbi:MAG TPA: ABC transporter ATP-binding protein [Gammaproteobacteria bacterium]|nr:ABC transporter ATP-binding protein [Gammaproteobacteria bacterium]